MGITFSSATSGTWALFTLCHSQGEKWTQGYLGLKFRHFLNFIIGDKADDRLGPVAAFGDKDVLAP